MLGPVEVWIGDNQIVLKRRQERLLLAVLLLEPGRTVASDRLIELLWPESQPANPRRALQVYVSRVRTVLAPDGGAALIGRHEGYAIELPPGQTDIEQYTALLEQARGEAVLEERVRLLTEALALWRGPALTDVAADDVRRRLCGGLEESRWAAQELRLETELALGRHELLLPELAGLCAAEPAREALAAARMLALYRSGRQADALNVYVDLVRHLGRELGLEPGPEIRELQVSILRQDDALQLQGEDETVLAPNELPVDDAVLVGRDELLRELSEHLGRVDGPGGVPRVVCLYGGAGIGKSAIAVRLGHQLAAAYPGGQLFVRLRDVSGDAVPVREVLGRMLRSLAVEPSRVPDSIEERSALVRSQLADRAVLLVFDDATDVAQIRPLLPATDRCAVVITSRQPLIGLEDAVHRSLRRKVQGWTSGC